MSNKTLAFLGIGAYILSVFSSATDLDGNSIAPVFLVAISGPAMVVFVVWATIRLWKEARGISILFATSSITLFILEGFQVTIEPVYGSPLIILTNIAAVVCLVAFILVVVKLFKLNKTSKTPQQ